MVSFRCSLFLAGSSVFAIAALAGSGDPATYTEPKDEEYWRPENSGTELPYAIPRIKAETLTREGFDKLILDGKIFVVEGISSDWPMRTWDCDFFKKDKEFKKAAMNHQYAAGGGRDTRLGDDWLNDKTPSGAENASAPQIAPFYWGIKDVQYEQRPGWKMSMLKRVAKNFRVPHFMDPDATKGSFSRTPEFWFGTKTAGAKAHMDSHIQATLSVQIAGTKRWRLMPLRSRKAPFIAMIYSDGQPYTNSEGWRPLLETVLEPGDGLFFPPGIIHETQSLGEQCASSVTFQFDSPFAARFYKRFFPRVRRTADIHESWIVIRDWARLGMKGDEKGKGASYEKAKQSKELRKHFEKLDADKSDRLTLNELEGPLGSHAVNALAWHDEDGDGSISFEEFVEWFAFWSAVTDEVVRATPEKWRKFQLFGTIENLEDLPPKIAKKSLEASLSAEEKLLKDTMRSEL
eukprot:TRINITY_DN16121_c0_g4_i1.p1 TRINITY_DN16121_c0_g4~~TRINITY_DN16121_c0_g4_i1.p1  ORF type:complete len:480 (+),score=78.88 TRINITY_DN16121_c0_g4_i1:58-1440(+)